MISISNISVQVLDGEFAFCDICSNYVPQVLVTEDGYPEQGCQYCWEAYGEIN
jgi:hypothetical protein